jgi:hypothetical protein
MTVQRAGALSKDAAQFALQTERPTRLLVTDTVSSPQFSTTAAHPANLVHFIVDTAGSPILQSVRPAGVKDTELYSAFLLALSGWRFEPAQMSDGCKVNELVIGDIEWPRSRAP